MNGWPNDVPSNLKTFWYHRLEFSVIRGCLLRGNQVVVPSSLQQKVLQEIHSGHHGIVRTKSVARSYVWWPGLNGDVEDLVRKCQTCQELRRNPPTAPPLSWPAPSHAWERVHFDYLTISGHVFLIIVDAYSRFPVIKLVPSMSAAILVKVTRGVFADFGCPKCIVSDNGTQLVSAEFRSFLAKNGVKFLNSPPYHPASNGLAERGVRSFKELFVKFTNDDLSARLARVLFTLRATVCTATGKRPADLF